jgi:hypothetical protein
MNNEQAQSKREREREWLKSEEQVADLPLIEPLMIEAEIEGEEKQLVGESAPITVNQNPSQSQTQSRTCSVQSV